MPTQISFESRKVNRLFPLTISRGTTAEVNTLFVHITDGIHTGTGEGMRCYGALFDVPEVCTPLLQDLFRFATENKLSIHEIAQEGQNRQIPAPGLAALDIALWDLLAKQAGIPLYTLLGLPKPTVPTSVTVGIEPPEIVKERISYFCNLTKTTKIKVKLGSPEGDDHDREIFRTAQEAAKPFGATIRADANGGWDVSRAVRTIGWLADHGCDYIEQPLPVELNDALPELMSTARIPIFLDESIRTSQDVIRLKDSCHGVNLKLMKSGGITEGHRVLTTAKACGLQTMIGCMSDTSIAIAAGAALSGLCDHIDLDNHFNLDPDPATGLSVVNGVVTPPDSPGHGATLNPA